MHRVGVLTLALTFAASLAAAAPDRRVADAAKARDRAALQSLLKQHADVNGTQGDGATALHWAAHWDDARRGPRADCRRRQRQRGDRPGRDAARTGRDERQRADGRGAAQGRRESECRVERRRDAADDRGACPAAPASSRALLDAGADIKAAETSAGQTALMRAVAENHADVVATAARSRRGRQRAIEEPVHGAALRRAAREHRDRAAVAEGGRQRERHRARRHRRRHQRAAHVQAGYRGVGAAGRDRQRTRGDGALPARRRASIRINRKRDAPRSTRRCSARCRRSCEALLEKGADPNARTFKAMPLLVALHPAADRTRHYSAGRDAVLVGGELRRSGGRCTC